MKKLDNENILNLIETIVVTILLDFIGLTPLYFNLFEPQWFNLLFTVVALIGSKLIWYVYADSRYYDGKWTASLLRAKHADGYSNKYSKSTKKLGKKLIELGRTIPCCRSEDEITVNKDTVYLDTSSNPWL